MSRQARWQRKHRLLGECIICGKPRCFTDDTYCNYHRLTANLNKAVREVVAGKHKDHAPANLV